VRRGEAGELDFCNQAVAAHSSVIVALHNCRTILKV
jgi:hypothetical protein